MIHFHNPGKLDIRAACTFGISVKEHSNPIGFFGTGLKYAIAVILRHGCEIQIQSGEELFKFSSKQISFRGSPISLVTMNDQELGFTLDLGKTWDLWMAYRELWCNCRDEHGEVEEVAGPIDPNSTTITVSGGEFDLVHEARDSFILNSAPISEIAGVEVHLGKSKSIFYRGIKIMEVPDGLLSLYTYNITAPLTLTEDRTAKYSWEVENFIEKAIMQLELAAPIKDVLTARKGDWEAGFNYDQHRWLKGSDQFVSTLHHLTTSQIGDMNQTALVWHKAQIQEKLEPNGVSPSEAEMLVLRPAVDFWAKLGIQISAPLFVSKNLGESILALAYQGNIYIAERTLREPFELIARMLAEEQFHISTGFGDCTRDMQHFLFETLVKIGLQALEAKTALNTLADASHAAD